MPKYDIRAKDGHVDKYRREIPDSGLGHVRNTQTWSTQKAFERYGAPSGQHETEARGLGPQHPQAPEDKHDAAYANDTPNDWRRGANETAEHGPESYTPNFRSPTGHASYRDSSVEDQHGQPPLRHHTKQPR